MQIKPQHGLSPKKRAVLLAIAHLLEANDWPPSFRQVGERSGISEIQVAYWIRLLTADGIVQRELNARHDMYLTPKGWRLAKQLRKKAA